MSAAHLAEKMAVNLAQWLVDLMADMMAHTWAQLSGHLMEQTMAGQKALQTAGRMERPTALP
jgi:hypothetical protein